MIWAMVIIAMMIGVLVEVACFYMKVKNIGMVMALQFIVTFAVTYGLSYSFAGSELGMQSILLSCAGISFAIVLLTFMLRRYLGSWYDRHPGPGVK